MIHVLHLRIVHHFLHVRRINYAFIDEANHIYNTMPMYNLIEYSDNNSDASGSLWQFKRDEVPLGNADLSVDNNCIFNSQSFKYKGTLVGKTKDAVNNTNTKYKK